MEGANLPSNFLTFIDNGQLRVSFQNSPLINFSSFKGFRIIDIVDIPIQLTNKPGLIKQLSEAKSLAKKLKQENITLEIRLKGEPVLKLGEKANPKLAKIVTLSSDIEITDLKKLKKLSDMI